MKLDINVVGCSWLIIELFNIVELEFKKGRNPFAAFNADSDSPFFKTISFFTCGISFDSVSLLPFPGKLPWVPVILVLFFTIVSPSAVTIFFGQRFNFVCLMSPFR